MIEIGDYFNFHNHTIYSTLSATSHFNELIKAAENDYKAVGMVDLGNLMGAFKFVSEVEKYNGDIKKKKAEG
jgi:DNA polymerase-3 subunit alpha